MQQGQILTLGWQEGFTLLYVPDFQADELKADYFFIFLFCQLSSMTVDYNLAIVIGV